MTSEQTRVLLLGLGPTAESALAGLHERFAVLGVVRPDEPGDSVVDRARARGIPVFPQAGLGDVSDLVRELKPQCVISSSYDRVLPAGLLRECAFVNVHYSPLPRYRGRANVNWSIINGEQETAITIHTIAADLDAGRILYQERVPIGPRDTVTDLYERLNGLQQENLAASVLRHVAGEPGAEQDEAAATYCCARVPDDGEIDWAGSTAAADRLVRALAHPFPGAFTVLDLRRLWVLRAQPADDAPVYEGRVPGRVVRVDRGSGAVDVLTGDGVLTLLEVRPDGGPAMPAADVVRSTRRTLGVRTGDLLDRLAGLSAEVHRLSKEVTPGS